MIILHWFSRVDPPDDPKSGSKTPGESLLDRIGKLFLLARGQEMSLWEANGGKSRFGQPQRPEFSLSQSHKVPEAYGPVVPKKLKPRISRV